MLVYQRMIILGMGQHQLGLPKNRLEHTIHWQTSGVRDGWSPSAWTMAPTSSKQLMEEKYPGRQLWSCERCWLPGGCHSGMDRSDWCQKKRCELGWLFPIYMEKYGKITNVPNHRPDSYFDILWAFDFHSYPDHPLLSAPQSTYLSAKHLLSVTMGWPTCAICKRIWCCRPVTIWSANLRGGHKGHICQTCHC